MPIFIANKYNINNKFMTIREVLQVYGTDIIRNMFGENIWINALKQYLDREVDLCRNLYLITDCRFVNEARAIKSWGGKVWRIVGDRGIVGDNHRSEIELDNYKDFDAVIINNLDTGVRSLKKQIKEILGKE